MINDIVKKYIYYSEIKDTFYKDFEYKKSNKATKELMKLNNVLIKNRKMAEAVIDKLIDSNNLSLLIWINSLALDIKYRQEYAIMNLKKIIENDNLGLYVINVQMILIDKGIIDSPWGEHNRRE